MTKTAKLFAAGFVAAALAAAAPSTAGMGAASVTATGTLGVPGCVIGTAALDKCSATMTLSSGLARNSACAIAVGYDSVGAQQGLCSFTNGGSGAATAPVTVSTTADCTTLTIVATQPSATFNLVDAVGDRWALRSLRVYAVHQHSSGMDHWAVDPSLSRLRLENAEGRIMNLQIGGGNVGGGVGGSLYSGSNCKDNVGTTSLGFQIEFAGQVF